MADAIGKQMFMQSLKTTVKRDAERLSRQVSVQFDTICREALIARDLVKINVSSGLEGEGALTSNSKRAAEAILDGIPNLIRLAATQVVQEQQRNPAGWQDVVRRWRDFYEAMKLGRVPVQALIPAVEAQAILNGFEMAIKGMPLPVQVASADEAGKAQRAKKSEESWPHLCDRALILYREKVGVSRYSVAKRRLIEVTPITTNEDGIQAALLSWCQRRLKEVQPRSVRTQLDCMLSALRCVLPELKAPIVKELRGVMQPRVTDRQSMPVQKIRAALEAIKARPTSERVRKDYGGGASQFDEIAIETLAVLGMRPRELVQAKSDALISKSDVFGNKGLFLRIAIAKNKASEREIPLSDGKREIVDVRRLREMLEWQEENQRSLSGAVTSLNTRFKKVAGNYTLYQMRHSWKDVAVHADVDYELRERILGHDVKGVAAVYGSGIPLANGLNALQAIRSKICIADKETDNA